MRPVWCLAPTAPRPEHEGLARDGLCPPPVISIRRQDACAGPAIGSRSAFVVARFVAAGVEFVEALTIVLANGVVRGRRPALAGAALPSSRSGAHLWFRLSDRAACLAFGSAACRRSASVVSVCRGCARPGCARRGPRRCTTTRSVRRPGGEHVVGGRSEGASSPHRSALSKEDYRPLVRPTFS